LSGTVPAGAELPRSFDRGSSHRGEVVRRERGEASTRRPPRPRSPGPHLPRQPRHR
jgi:hypothetical protein